MRRHWGLATTCALVLLVAKYLCGFEPLIHQYDSILLVITSLRKTNSLFIGSVEVVAAGIIDIFATICLLRLAGSMQALGRLERARSSTRLESGLKLAPPITESVEPLRSLDAGLARNRLRDSLRLN